MQTPLACALALPLAILCVFGCSNKEARAPKEGDQAKAGSKEVLDPGASRVRGDAFGLPLPPRVLSVERNARHIRVYTDMKIVELEKFYKNQLVDYEVLRSGNTIRAIPLRSYMPWVTVIKPWSYSDPSVVNYRLPLGEELSQKEGVASRPVKPPKPPEQVRRENQQRLKARFGTPVGIRMPDGKLLAPGARWGKPYYPPKGSPLAKEVENHGKPFGEWEMN